MVCTPPPGMLKLIVSTPAVKFASCRAARSGHRGGPAIRQIPSPTRLSAPSPVLSTVHVAAWPVATASIPATVNETSQSPRLDEENPMRDDPPAMIRFSFSLADPGRPVTEQLIEEVVERYGLRVAPLGCEKRAARPRVVAGHDRVRHGLVVRLRRRVGSPLRVLDGTRPGSLQGPLCLSSTPPCGRLRGLLSKIWAVDKILILKILIALSPS